MSTNCNNYKNTSHKQLTIQYISELQSFVAFVAEANIDISYINGDVLQFQNSLTNHGNAYDSSTGTFTCPVTGYYFFTGKFTEENGSLVSAGLYLDDDDEFTWVTDISKWSLKVDTLGHEKELTIGGAILCQEGQNVKWRAQRDFALDKGMRNVITGHLLKAFI